MSKNSLLNSTQLPPLSTARLLQRKRFPHQFRWMEFSRASQTLVFLEKQQFAKQLLAYILICYFSTWPGLAQRGGLNRIQGHACRKCGMQRQVLPACTVLEICNDSWMLHETPTSPLPPVSKSSRLVVLSVQSCFVLFQKAEDFAAAILTCAIPLPGRQRAGCDSESEKNLSAPLCDSNL